MSNVRPPRNVVGSLHPTRQQLDELDALLQKMLDLPVNRVEEKTAEKESARSKTEGGSSARNRGSSAQASKAQAHRPARPAHPARAG